MNIRRAAVNNRKAQLELTVRSGKVFAAYVDEELGSEAVTYILESGAEGPVHIDHALEYNEDPSCVVELLIHKLTVEARRLSTSVPQLSRLLDPANTRKSLGQLIGLLHLLDCEVQLVVKPRRAA
jgi:hypothetical protein